jgi:hypothetical protein
MILSTSLLGKQLVRARTDAKQEKGKRWEIHKRESGQDQQNTVVLLMQVGSERKLL